MSNRLIKYSRNFFIVPLFTFVSIALYLVGYLTNLIHGQTYLIFNLFLAYIPLLLSLLLVRVLKFKLWSSYSAILLTVIWFIFLPNTFYMISDYIHLASIVGNNNQILYNVITFTSFIFCSTTIGCYSLRQVEKEILKRYNALISNLAALVILLTCSIAVFIGRDLRWNSWSVITNPGGILIDLYNIVVSPTAAVFQIIISFFVLFVCIYAVYDRPKYDRPKNVQ